MLLWGEWDCGTVMSPQVTTPTACMNLFGEEWTKDADANQNRKDDPATSYRATSRNQDTDEVVIAAALAAQQGPGHRWHNSHQGWPAHLRGSADALEVVPCGDAVITTGGDLSSRGTSSTRLASVLYAAAMNTSRSCWRAPTDAVWRLPSSKAYAAFRFLPFLYVGAFVYPLAAGRTYCAHRRLSSSWSESSTV